MFRHLVNKLINLLLTFAYP